jgi:hypothetical protein
MPENENKISLQKSPPLRMEERLERLEVSMAANTSMTKEVADRQMALAAVLAKIDVGKIIMLVDAVESMKGGVKVLGWFERPAKWLATVAAAAGVIWSLWEHK